MTHGSRILQILFASLCSLAQFAVVSCGEKADQQEVLADASSQESGVPMIPGTARSPFRDDPAAGGWETERWSADIGVQIGRLKKVLVEGDEADLMLAAISTVDCESSQLHVIELERSGESVYRLGASSGVPAAASLREAVDGLRNRFASASPRHASAKIVKITPDGDGRAATAVAFQLDGPAAPDGSDLLQINARWECGWSLDGEWKLHSLKLTDYEEVRAPQAAFADATQAALGGDANSVAQFFRGQDHWMARIEMGLGIDVSAWQGLALADVDGDGLEDLYISQPGGLPNRLLRHRPDGTLEDISAAAGVDWLEVAHGSLFSDLDNDGDPDLIVGSSVGILIMENDGTGKFTVAASEMMTDGLPYSISAADVDQDGDTDLFVCGYTPRAGVTRHHLFVHPVPYHDANNGGRNLLLRNDGKWRFSDVTKITGLGEHNSRFSYSSTWEDYDLDGDLDLYVANDFGRNNLYRSELAQSGRVRFKDVAEEAGVVDIAPGMSACWGDYDNDGRADLYVGNMFSSAGNRIASQPKFHASADAETRSQFLRHARGNSLFKNSGDGKFSDVSEPMGVTLGRWAWSSKFADLDNDGWQDIVVANGFITQEDSGDL